MTLKVETCVAQHIGDRTEQQDRVAMFPHGKEKGVIVAVLADGMGGHTGGALAAQQLIHVAKQKTTLDPLPDRSSIQSFMASIITETHTAITLTRFTSEQDPHSTACVLIMQPDRVDWAYCGDSRIYHYRHGSLVARTRDHSYVNKLVQEGFITEAEASVHPKRNVLISCLGEITPPAIDFGFSDHLGAGDLFILCSDGLWGYWDDVSMGAVLANHPPRVASEQLIAQARAAGNGHGDNISIAIVKLTEVVEDKRPVWRREVPKKSTPS